MKNPKVNFQPPRARARKTDPETSHEAANRVEASGGAGAHRALILDFLRDLGGAWTSAEIARYVDLDRHQVARRLPELREKGLVVNDRQRTCSVNKTKAVEWRAKGC